MSLTSSNRGVGRNGVDDFESYRQIAPESLDDQKLRDLIKTNAGNKEAILGAIENIWHDIPDDKAVGSAWVTASKAKKDIVPSKTSQSAGGRGGGGRGTRGGRSAPSGRGGRGDRERERPNRPSTAIKATDAAASNNVPAATSSSGSSFAWGNNTWGSAAPVTEESSATEVAVEQPKAVAAVAPAHVPVPAAPIVTTSVASVGGWSSGLTLAERLKRKAEESTRMPELSAAKAPNAPANASGGDSVEDHTGSGGRKGAHRQRSRRPRGGSGGGNATSASTTANQVTGSATSSSESEEDEKDPTKSSSAADGQVQGDFTGGGVEEGSSQVEQQQEELQMTARALELVADEEVLSLGGLEEIDGEDQLQQFDDEADLQALQQLSLQEVADSPEPAEASEPAAAVTETSNGSGGFLKLGKWESLGLEAAVEPAAFQFGSFAAPETTATSDEVPASSSEAKTAGWSEEEVAAAGTSNSSSVWGSSTPAAVETAPVSKPVPAVTSPLYPATSATTPSQQQPRAPPGLEQASQQQSVPSKQQMGQLSQQSQPQRSAAPGQQVPRYKSDIGQNTAAATAPTLQQQQPSQQQQQQLMQQQQLQQSMLQQYPQQQQQGYGQQTLPPGISASNRNSTVNNSSMNVGATGASNVPNPLTSLPPYAYPTPISFDHIAQQQYVHPSYAQPNSASVPVGLPLGSAGSGSSGVVGPNSNSNSNAGLGVTGSNAGNSASSVSSSLQQQQQQPQQQQYNPAAASLPFYGNPYYHNQAYYYGQQVPNYYGQGRGMYQQPRGPYPTDVYGNAGSLGYPGDLYQQTNQFADPPNYANMAMQVGGGVGGSNSNGVSGVGAQGSSTVSGGGVSGVNVGNKPKVGGPSVAGQNQNQQNNNQNQNQQGLMQQQDHNYGYGVNVNPYNNPRFGMDPQWQYQQAAAANQGAAWGAPPMMFPPSVSPAAAGLGGGGGLTNQQSFSQQPQQQQHLGMGGGGGMGMPNQQQQVGVQQQQGNQQQQQGGQQVQSNRSSAFPGQGGRNSASAGGHNW
mmetsp:Transcript_10425/g.15709  ORF Transcript_10425/g.15709 Transcript_10425/m.15709 type:complete len:1026 (-) Transcript_10425:128-3205(-)